MTSPTVDEDVSSAGRARASLSSQAPRWLRRGVLAAVAPYGLMYLAPHVPYWCGALLNAASLGLTWLLLWGIVGLALLLMGLGRRPRVVLAWHAVAFAVAVMGAVIAVLMVRQPTGSAAAFTEQGELREYTRRGTCVHTWTPEYAATYSFDRDGCRHVPAPRSLARGPLMFLGCSFTFGYGVNDDEAFPAIVAAEYATDRQVHNCGVNGGGIGEGWLWLRHWLEDQPPPAAVYYGWISRQRQRNSARPMRLAPEQDFDFRLFELGDDGRPRYEGKVWRSQLPESRYHEGFDEEELQLCLALFRELRDCCAQREIPFTVLLLEQTAEPSPTVAEMLLRPDSGIRAVDLRPWDRAEEKFPVDGHPRPAWHRTMAAQIALDLRRLESSPESLR